MRSLCLAAVLAILALVAVGATGQEYDFELDDVYGEDYDQYEGYYATDFGYYEDDAYAYEDDDEGAYYNDEYQEMYEYSGQYMDPYGDEYSFEQGEDALDCQIEEGRVVISGELQACDVRLSGADSVLTGLAGGLDGVYRITGCYSDRPLYTRVDGAPGEERTLWYNSNFFDWDITPGPAPLMANIAMFGKNDTHKERPNFVLSNWRIPDILTAEGADNPDGQVTWLELPLKVECEDGSVLAAKEYDPFGTVALITDEEAEAKYDQIIRNNLKETPTPINMSSVLIVLAVGAVMIVGVPYIMFTKHGPDGKNFAQMLEASRKKRSGHIS